MINFPESTKYAPNLNWDLLNRYVAPVSLRAIARNRENARARLDQNQGKAIHEVSVRSKNKASDNIQNLKDYIVAQYRAHPALVGGQELPLEYTVGLTKEENKAYYLNIYHTAYRYLLSPPFYNEWMHPNALHVNRNHNGAWSLIFKESMKSMAVIWEALCDETYPLTYSKDDAKELVVRALFDLGRAHNWDRYRPDGRGGMKQYDDGEADRPSCSNGVDQRLVQTLVLCKAKDPKQPELPVKLSVDNMCTMFKEHFISDNEKGTSIFQEIERLVLKDLQEVKNAYEQWIVDMGEFDALNAKHQKLLKSLTHQWTTDDIIEFIGKVRAYYGSDPIMTEQEHSVHPLYKFKSYGQWIIHLAQNTLPIYAEMVIEKINHRVEELVADPAKQRAVEQLARERAVREQVIRERTAVPPIALRRTVNPDLFDYACAGIQRLEEGLSQTRDYLVRLVRPSPAPVPEPTIQEVAALPCTQAEVLSMRTMQRFWRLWERELSGEETEGVLLNRARHAPINFSWNDYVFVSGEQREQGDNESSNNPSGSNHLFRRSF